MPPTRELPENPRGAVTAAAMIDDVFSLILLSMLNVVQKSEHGGEGSGIRTAVGFAPCRRAEHRAVDQNGVQPFGKAALAHGIPPRTGSRLIRDPTSYGIPPHRIPPRTGSHLIRDPASYEIPPHTGSHLIGSRLI